MEEADMSPAVNGAAAPVAEIDHHDERIDALLERYLLLLDEYSTLRGRLGTLQAGIYQDVARANFGADRGLRYGQDFYQAREKLRALRTLEISTTTATMQSSSSSENTNPSALPVVDTPCFKVLELKRDHDGERRAEGGETEEADYDDDDGGGGCDGQHEREHHDSGVNLAAAKEENEEQLEQSPPTDPVTKGARPAARDEEKKKEAEEKEESKPQNPLQWFGFMAPQALRSAQGHAIEMVQDVVPSLASVDAEMRSIEIEIGRARKKRAKARKAQATTQGGTPRQPVAVT